MVEAHQDAPPEMKAALLMGRSVRPVDDADGRETSSGIPALFTRLNMSKCDIALSFVALEIRPFPVRVFLWSYLIIPQLISYLSRIYEIRHRDAVPWRVLLPFLVLLHAVD